MIFAQVGILTMMINALKVYANKLKEAQQQTGTRTCIYMYVYMNEKVDCMCKWNFVGQKFWQAQLPYYC